MTSEIENAKQTEPKTRQQRRQAKVIARAERVKKNQIREKKTEQKKTPKLRLIPIWLRLLIVAILIIISLIAGLMFGYGIIGNGNAIDILKPSTWKHLVDLVLQGTTGN